jgi:hypothetical protein
MESEEYINRKSRKERMCLVYSSLPQDIVFRH